MRTPDRDEEHREQCPLCERRTLRWRGGLNDSDQFYECDACGRFRFPDIRRCWHCTSLRLTARMVQERAGRAQTFSYCSHGCVAAEKTSYTSLIRDNLLKFHAMRRWRKALADFIA